MHALLVCRHAKGEEGGAVVNPELYTCNPVPWSPKDALACLPRACARVPQSVRSQMAAFRTATVRVPAKRERRHLHPPRASTPHPASLPPARPLQVANLGDSGVRLVRSGRIVWASAAQQHMFNMPFQLSHPSIIDSPDDADSADVTHVDVQVCGPWLRLGGLVGRQVDVLPRCCSVIRCFIALPACHRGRLPAAVCNVRRGCMYSPPC
jgi:hypothetical protein